MKSEKLQNWIRFHGMRYSQIKRYENSCGSEKDLTNLIIFVSPYHDFKWRHIRGLFVFLIFFNSKTIWWYNFIDLTNNWCRLNTISYHLETSNSGFPRVHHPAHPKDSPTLQEKHLLKLPLLNLNKCANAWM